MSKTVLLTAATEDSGSFLKLLKQQEAEVIHYPLERYEPIGGGPEIRETMGQITEYDNIIYSNKRNAAFFMDRVRAADRKEEVRQCLNLTKDEETAEYLEGEGIPAVCSFAGKKSINLVEFMLRLHRMGPTLYPCGDHRKEEIPGFLEELDIPVKELELFTLEGPGEESLSRYRNELAERQPDIVVFHSRRAVNRVLAAFPDLPYEDLTVITADKAITEKLEEKGIPVENEAGGDWESIAALIG